MPAFKLVMGLRNGKTVQKELPEDKSAVLMGRKVGDKVDGSQIGFDGYEFVITGGSDNCGFPMRRDVHGTARKRILGVEGIGQKKIAKGIKYRKTVAGDTIFEGTAQINLKVEKEGAAPLAEQAPEGEKKA